MWYRLQRAGSGAAPRGSRSVPWFGAQAFEVSFSPLGNVSLCAYNGRYFRAEVRVVQMFSEDVPVVSPATQMVLDAKDTTHRERSRAKVEERIQSIQKDLHTLHNRMVPINCLPPEILPRIFFELQTGTIRFSCGHQAIYFV